MATEKISLMTFIEDIFPQQKVKVGTGSIVLKAMPFGTLVSIIAQLKELGATLKEQGVTWDNYQEQEFTMKAAITIVEEFPELLSEVTTIDIESLKAIPLDVLVEIISATVEVNMSAKDKFIKNFQSLTGNFQKMMKVTKKEDNKGKLKK